MQLVMLGKGDSDGVQRRLATGPPSSQDRTREPPQLVDWHALGLVPRPKRRARRRPCHLEYRGGASGLHGERWLLLVELEGVVERDRGRVDLRFGHDTTDPDC